LIVALNVYLQNRPTLPGHRSQEIADLSRTLKRLGERLFQSEGRSGTFRNENGVYMKLMNFRRLDPEYTARGRKGLSRGAKAEEDVWLEFANDPIRCKRAADAVVASLSDPETVAKWLDLGADLQEAPEGRLLTRTHLARERDRGLVEAKRRQVLERQGKLKCEACAFEFGTFYGERGELFIECHHT
jgi:5-methylcytosine-specific restriction protein A